MPSVTPKSVSLSSLKATAAELKKHVAKADTNKDGSLSVSEARRYGNSLGDDFKVGGALVTMTSWALREQEGRGSSSVSVKSVQNTVDSAIAVISNKDTNKNGKLEAGPELNAAKRLKTFQALANLAGVDVVGGSTGLSAKQLGAAIAPFAKDANYTSESDYAPKFVSANLTGAFSAQSAVAALGPELKKFFAGDDGGSKAFETFSATAAKSFLSGLAESSGPDDAKSAKAFAGINALLKENLTDLQVLKYGPAGSNGKLASDNGLYAYVVVGKSKDGKAAGVLIGSVET